MQVGTQQVEKTRTVDVYEQAHAPNPDCWADYRESTGMSKADSGFERGNMQFDMNLRFNPPPEVVEVPRPEWRNFLPVYLSRDDD